MDSRTNPVRIGFWAIALVLLALTIASFGAVGTVLRSFGGEVSDDASDVIAVQRLRIASETMGRSTRGYLLTGEPKLYARLQLHEQQFSTAVKTLRGMVREERELRVLDRVEMLAGQYTAAVDEAIAARTRGLGNAAVATLFQERVEPARDELDTAVRELSDIQEEQLQDATRHARDRSAIALAVLGATAAVALAAAIAMEVWLARTLRELEQQRAETARQLVRVERLNTELDAFAGRVAHDVRNLLMPIGLAAGILRRTADRPDEVRRGAERIERHLDRCVAMMSGLLAFSRSGRPEPLAATSVEAGTQEVIEQLAPLASRVDARIDTDVADATVACSRELFNVVVLNILGNALKFIEGCDRRVVSIHARANAGWCRFSVVDTGPGIPEEAIEHVFEPYFRAPGTRAPGAGIGLATVARVVEAHGGHVELESKLGVGTTVTVRLPLAPADEQGDTPVSTREARREA